MFTEPRGSEHKLPLPPLQRESGRRFHNATERPPLPLPRHAPKRLASADYSTVPKSLPSAHNRELSVSTHSQSSLDTPPAPLPRKKRPTSADHPHTKKMPLPPHIDTVFTTTEQNQTHKAPSYQSRRLSVPLSDDDTHQQLQPITTGEINTTLQSLTHPAAPSPLPTSFRTLFIPTSCSMTSEEVADPQKVTLPQLFMVSNINSTSGIAKGSVVLVKYTKSTSMVHGRDQDGARIQMSLNTPATVSPITDECDQKRHMSAEEVLSSRPPPVAVKVMQPFTQRDFTVDQGTLLFLQTTETVARGTPKRLRFHDYRGNKIMLTASCTGIFSSHPHDVKLFLAELVVNFKFPIKVLFQDGIHSRKIVTLNGVCKQDILVVQLCSNHDGKPFGQDHELSGHPGLSLVRVALNYKKSKQVMHTTIPKSDAVGNASASRLQPYAGTASSMPIDHHGADHTMPEKENADMYLKMHGCTKMNQGSNYGGVGILGQQQHPLWNQSLMDGESNILPSDDPSTSNTDTLTPSQTATSTESTRDEGAPQSSNLKASISSGDGENDDDGDDGAGYLYVTFGNRLIFTPEEMNVAYLQTLNEADILQLLEAMKMDVYKPIFQREAVDGLLLSELTDEMLQRDLEVQSSLHRLRLGAVIKGTRSAKDLLASRQTNTQTLL